MFLRTDSLCTIDNAPSVAAERALTVSVPAHSWTSGITPEARPVSPASSPVTAIILFLALSCVLYNLRHTRRLFATFTSDVFGSRVRQNLFEETTAYETRSVLLLALQFCIVGAVILYLSATWYGAVPSIDTFPRMNTVMLLLTLIAAVWYVIHAAGYALTGWTFADPESTRVWVRVFNLSMGIFTLAAMLPVAAALYLPQTRPAMGIVTAVIFLITMSLPVIKGFRIFYTNIFSVLYFILYLCTLEIIPLALAFVAAYKLILLM